MIVNSINNRINPTIILLNNRVSSVQSPSVKPDNTKSDSFQRPPSFTGSINSPLVNHGSEILGKYMQKLHKIKSKNMTALYLKDCEYPCASTILFDEPMTLKNGIQALLARESKLKNKCERGILWFRPPINFRFHPKPLTKYLDILHDFKTFENTKIKGIIGSGCSCDAFLTADNNVLKFSDSPNFPHPDSYVQGLEIPIQKAYAFRSGKGELYVTQTPLVLDGRNKGLALPEYNSIWENMSTKLKKFNQKFDFGVDFQRSRINHAVQIGFVGNESYLLDHGCIWNRNFLKFTDKGSISRDSAFPIEFHEA